MENILTLNQSIFGTKTKERRISRRALKASVHDLYVPQESSEITYDDGYDIDGGFYISNDVLIATVIAVGINPIGGMLWGMGIYKLGCLISAAGAKLGAKIGGVIGGFVGTAIGALLGLGLVASVAFTVADALIQGKGINVHWKKTWFGMPYWVALDVE